MEEGKKEIEKKERKKTKVSVSDDAFKEARDSLFREAAELVSEDPSTRIAIFVAPRASDPDTSLYTFAHPNADGIVEAFLQDKPPPDPVPVPENTVGIASRGFWWEDGRFDNTDDPEVLRAGIEAMTKQRNQLLQILESRSRDEASKIKEEEARPTNNKP